MPDGEVGELFSHTPYVFDGYWKNPEKTAEAFSGHWCSVGDMARRDAGGRGLVVTPLDPDHVHHVYQIRADIRFHEFLYELAGNPLIAPAMDMHLTYTQRAMGEVLVQDQSPRDIWDQHAAILEAIASGGGRSRQRQRITFKLTRPCIRSEAQCNGPPAPKKKGTALVCPLRFGGDRWI